MIKKKFPIKQIEMMATILEILLLSSLGFLVFGYYGFSLQYYLVATVLSLIIVWRVWRYGELK